MSSPPSSQPQPEQLLDLDITHSSPQNASAMDPPAATLPLDSQHPIASFSADETLSTHSTSENSTSSLPRLRNNRRAQANAVRRNFSSLFAESSSMLKFVFLRDFIFFLFQIVVCVTILALSINEYCDAAPLRLFIIGHLVRFVVLMPTIFYRFIYLRPDGNDEASSSRLTLAFLRADKFFEMYNIFWFIMGNWWLSVSKATCSITSPMVTGLAFAIVIMRCIIILFPLLFLTAIIFCLPAVILLMRITQRITGVSIMHFQPPGNHRFQVAADNAIINQLTRAVYSPELTRSLSSDSSTSPLSSPQVPLSPSPLPTSQSSSVAPKSNTIHASSPRPIIEVINLDAEDAHCTICLGDYAACHASATSLNILSFAALSPDAQLKLFPGCRHHFHAQCLDDWLHVSGKCPLCMRSAEEEFLKETA